MTSAEGGQTLDTSIASATNSSQTLCLGMTHRYGANGTLWIRCGQEVSGSQLAEGSTDDRLKFMREIAMFDTSGIPIWIGAQRDLGSNQILWVQAQSNVTHEFWDSGQPSLYSGDCAAINGGPDWRLLQTAPCDLTDRMFMCQKAVSDPCEGRLDGGELSGRHCFSYFSTEVTFHEAEAACEALSSHTHLAEPYRENLFTFLHGFVNRKVSQSNVTHEFWDPGQPSLYSGDCATINGGPGWRLLQTAPCDLTDRMFMCQKAVSDPCEGRLDGGELSGRHCFSYFSTEVTFHEAEAACEALSSHTHLAEPYRENLFTFLHGFVNRKVFTTIIVPDRTEVNLEEHGLTYDGICELSFSVRACKEAFVKLWDQNNPMRFFKLILGGQDNTEARLEVHDPLIMPHQQVLANVTMDGILSCNEARIFHVKWPSHDELEIEPLSLVDANVIKSLTINRVAIGMPEVTGEWVIGSRDAQIILRASDHNNEHELRWVSNEVAIDSDWWDDGEPRNTFTGDFVAMAGLTNKLKVVSASDISNGYVCQKAVLFYTHYAPVAELTTGAVGGTSAMNQISRTIHVTSSQSGLVSVAWALLTEENSTDFFESFQGQDEQLEISVPENFVLGSSGIYSYTIKVQADEDIDVVITNGNDNMQFSYFVLPMFDRSKPNEYFILTTGGLLEGIDQISITSVRDNNNITIVLSEAHFRNVHVTKDGITYRFPVSGHVILAQEETLVLQSTSNLTGTMVAGSKGMLVIAGTLDATVSSTKADSTMATAIPINYLGTEYFTFPCIPLDDTQSDTFLLVAVYAETSISISGQEDIWLQNPGEFRDITLPRNGFYQIKSDFPFYANKLGVVETSGACSTSLLPSNLWRHTYSFVIKDAREIVVFIVETEDFSESRLSLDSAALPVTWVDCHNISGSSKIGCLLTFQVPGVHILSSDTDSTFPAYIYADLGTFVHCRALGIDLQLPDPSHEVFDPDEYLESKLCSYNTSSSPSPAATQETAPAAATTNLTQSQVEEAAKQLQQELTVSYRNTSSFKRSKTSATDHRASCAAIGMMGIVVMVTVSGFFGLSDMISFIQLIGKHISSAGAAPVKN
ncbi:neurogenic locus notch protein-like [Plakobranchus ocellatus]|uniref:Neurogenic locus notch protein-like n=1 Tax=Plakobranchus ocellatus TaxID=259542 RepID=A0AAV4C5E6_9GAST|nr:neurogenic locus notch protein-like [Plakobranchus ocellatus]